MTLAKRLLAVSVAGAVAGGAYLAHMPKADACGCFTPPDPSVPIVQAGENIAFDIKDGVVTSHIQIQYSGPAKEFGWLLPLPSVPELLLGSDELFVQLIQQTQPKYRLTATYWGDCPFDPSRSGAVPGATNDSSGGDPAPEEGGGDPLVLRDSVGPYDYAVLRADSKQPMLDWLRDNRFFVPTGTDDAVGPYIREGGYFLALKLRKGNEVGDIQPVVVKYASDLPMIPIVLTSVAADPDMGVEVWVAGEHRAIPRNYFHTRINDAMIDWINFGANYVDVVTDAVDEADGHHSFVTEYAGPSSIMQDILDYPGRFGNLSELSNIVDPIEYINYLNYNGFAVQSAQAPFFQPTFTSQTLSVLQRHLPVPSGLLDTGVTPNDYYTNIGYFLGYDRENRPELYADLDLDFDPAVLTAELEERVVNPTLEAGKLFRESSYLTRLFTTLSPEEMTKDPVFSFNPDLPDRSNVHEGSITYYCGIIDEDTPATTPARIVTEDGFTLDFPDGTGENPWADTDMPASRATEVLREEGDPDVVDDNTDDILAAIGSDGGGCSVGGGPAPVSGLLLLGLAAIFAIRRRRR